MPKRVTWPEGCNGGAQRAPCYWLRLVACLKAEYPALCRLLGEPLFEFFSRAYLEQHPSHSYSLYGLGNEFPQFLRRSQSAEAKRAASRSLRFALELARMEQARAMSARAEGPEAWEGSKGMGRCVLDAADSMRLLAGTGISIELPGTTRLLLTGHPFAAFRPWLEDMEPDAQPPEGVGYISIKRQHYRVGFEELADWQFFFLAAARRYPRPLLACAAAASRRSGRPVSELLASLAFWLPAAQVGGLVKLEREGTTHPDEVGY